MKALPLLLLLVGCRTRPADDLAPAPVVINACGGTAVLSSAPGVACGECGLLACDGNDALRCDQSAGHNACGQCGPLPAEECNGFDDDCNGVVDEGCPMRIALPPYNEQQLRISGDRMAIATSAGDLYSITVSTRQFQVLAARKPMPQDYQGQQRDPALDGDRIAWIDAAYTTYGSCCGPESLGALRTRDLSTGDELVLADSGATAPAVDAGRVVFGKDGLRLWRADLGTFRQLTTNAMDRRPELSGDWVVFERRSTSPNQSGIRALNLSSGEERELSASLDGMNVLPAISGTTVLWTHRGGVPAIYRHDLATGVRSQVPASDGAMVSRAHDGLACFWRSNPLYWDPFYATGIVVLDLASGRSFEVARSGGVCDLSGRRVAWLEYRAGVDPYFQDLLPNQP